MEQRQLVLSSMVNFIFIDNLLFLFFIKNLFFLERKLIKGFILSDFFR